MFIENGTRVKFNNGGDTSRIQRVQVATGRDLQRAPRVFATNDARGAMQIQVVQSGDVARYPFINPLPAEAGAPAAWFQYNKGITVTGSGVSQWDDQSGNARHLLQATDANRPINLPYSGSRYLYLPGVDSNFASTPDAAGASAGTGAGNDFEAYGRFKLNDWTPATNNILANKHAAAAPNFSWDFYIGATGAPVFRVSLDGTALITNTATASVSFADGSAGWVKVTRAQASGDVIFYTAADSDTVPTSWTKLGNTVSSTAGAIFDGNGQLRVGAGNAGTLTVNGACYRFVILSGIGGAISADFNAADGTDGASSFVSSTTGETWTVNTSGGKPAQIVGRSSILFDGAAHFLKCSAFTLNQPETVYLLFKMLSWTLNDSVCDGNAANGMNIYHQTATPRLTVYAGADGPTTTSLAVGAYGVLAAVFNGASSVLQVNNGTAATGNPGAGNAGGFTLGGNGTGLSGYENAQFLEAILFPAAHDASTRARVVQYLAGVGGVSL